MTETLNAVIVLDCSGSMAGFVDDVVDGLNALLEDQMALDGEMNLTLIEFESRTRVPYRNVPIDEFPWFDPQSSEPGFHRYFPGGMTALLDGVGEACSIEGANLIIVQTDGMENSSVEWDYEKLKARIEELQEEGVQFMFLGANIDSFAVGGSLGVNKGLTMQFGATGEGVRSAVNATSSAISRYRMSNLQDATALLYTEEDRKKSL